MNAAANEENPGLALRPAVDPDGRGRKGAELVDLQSIGGVLTLDGLVTERSGLTNEGDP